MNRTRLNHPTEPIARGYRPADERDLKAERETAFENGFFVGMGVCALLATLLIAAFYIAARLGTP